MRKATSSFSAGDMRERKYLTFDTQNPRHMEALRIFTEQPEKLRSEYVISCILRAQEEERLENLIRQTIRDALAGCKISAGGEIPKEREVVDIADLPDALLTMMEDF